MGNCQAVDNASFVLQTQNGRSERFYSPISAADVMKLHPGHCVALLLTTTFYSSSDQYPLPLNNNPNNPPATATPNTINHNHHPLRVTRIKLLRPTDNLALGHAYRLITNHEVMKGLKAKKNGKLNNKNFQPPESAGITEAISDSDARGKAHQQMRKQDKHRPRLAAPAKSSSNGTRPRGWHPSLNSISEATS